MIKEILHEVKSRLAELEKPNLLLAVSGGVDSMLLWYALRELKITHAVAHINYQLRNEDSNKDQALIEKVAQGNGVKAHIKSIKTKSLQANPNASIQELARDLRYAFFEDLRTKFSYTHLLTAHHLDDSIETFFINLNRGTGIKGLTGIQSNEKTIRPLLNFTKEQLYQAAKEVNLEYREDLSNQKSDYLRNFFRLEILPQWKDRNPQFQQAMQANMKKLQEVNELVQEVVSQQSQAVQNEFEAGEVTYQALLKVKHQRIVFGELLQPYGFTISQIDDFIKLIKTPRSGKKLEASELSLFFDREKVIVEQKKSKTTKVNQEIDSIPCKITNPMVLNFQRQEEFPQNLKEEGVYYFNLTKLQLPLNLRSWEEGDKLKPLGMSGFKKVSDILIDHKVAMPDKSKVLVLESETNIIAVIGFCMSEDYKLQKDTNQILKVQWKL